jgi:phage terminase small subunit
MAYKKPVRKEKMSLRKWKFKTDEGLSVQETKFADFYTENPIAKEAAVRAGIPEHLAQNWGSHTLRKLAIKRRVRDNLQEIHGSIIMQARERREVLSGIARASVMDAMNLNEKGTPTSFNLRKAKLAGAHRAIASISVEESVDCQGGRRSAASIKMTSPVSAIDILNKMDNVYDKKLSKGGSLVIIPLEDMDL